jgi:hypothetical protein
LNLYYTTTIIIMPQFQFPQSLASVFALLLLVTSSVHGLAGRPTPTYNGGGGVGRFVLEEDALKFQTHYDMLLVERLQNRKSSQNIGEGALYVPDGDLPRLHLCRVLSIGPGREEENGSLAPNLDGIVPGDLILSKDPWGIGPKDEELEDGTKLSYMRSINVAAKVTGDLVAETK